MHVPFLESSSLEICALCPRFLQCWPRCRMACPLPFAIVPHHYLQETFLGCLVYLAMVNPAEIPASSIAVACPVFAQLLPMCPITCFTYLLR